MDHTPAMALAPEENVIPETTGPKAYFDYQQYMYRLFNEYEWQRQSSDASDESDSGETLTESITSSHVSKENSSIATEKVTSSIRQKAIKKRRKRQLFQFRKWLQPKNATAALHEMLGAENAEFLLYQQGSVIKAEVMVNNVKYEAIERSKNLAKKTVSEQALRELVVAQMAKVESDAKSQHDATKNLPVEYLAPYALHKLFTEWEVKGFKAKGKEAPIVEPSFPEASVSYKEQPELASKFPKVPKTVADLPEDAPMLHPGMLFAYMRPQVAYDDLGITGNPNDMGFSAGLRTDDNYFIGKGRTKRLARKAAAVVACHTLFGVVFDESVMNF